MCSGHDWFNRSAWMDLVDSGFGGDMQAGHTLRQRLRWSAKLFAGQMQPGAG